MKKFRVAYTTTTWYEVHAENEHIAEQIADTHGVFLSEKLHDAEVEEMDED